MSFSKVSNTSHLPSTLQFHGFSWPCASRQFLVETLGVDWRVGEDWRSHHAQKSKKCASSIKKLSLCCETTRLWMMPQGGFFVLCGVGIDGPFESSFWDASLCNAQFYSCLVMLPCTVTANRMGGIISIIVRILNMKVLSCMPQW